MKASDWDLEPETLTETIERGLAPLVDAKVPDVVGDGFRIEPMGLTQVLPEQFPLMTLLQFLPDVKLKQQLDAQAAEALALKVVGVEGLKKADAILTVLRGRVGGTELLFDGTEKAPGPTALAYQLHKRLTGLRGDFCAKAREAIDTVGRLVIAEQRRLKDVEDEQKRRDQERADAEARQNAARAAETAVVRGEAPAVVNQLLDLAETATAPPVPTRSASTSALASNATVEKWKTRFAGTKEDDPNPQPDVQDMSKEQLTLFREICRRVANEDLSVAVLAGINWSYLDARAKKEKKTLEIPGIEAYDEGSLRAKPKGRR